MSKEKEDTECVEAEERQPLRHLREAGGQASTCPVSAFSPTCSPLSAGCQKQGQRERTKSGACGLRDAGDVATLKSPACRRRAHQP